MASSQPVSDLGRRERHKREVRERILSAAMARFVRQGFEDTTVDQIAEDADVAQKTCFDYFPTKQRLLRELAEERFDELQEILEMVGAGFGSVMNNWVNIADYSVKDRLAQTAAFLGEAVSPTPIGTHAKGGER
jgi:AcrR family transcriptional regulator